MKIRTLLVDDEPLARQRLRALLENDADIDILGECGDGKTALAALREHRPDLVFLDVQMPVLDGFGVLAGLCEQGETIPPAVVFVTAHDRYALKAFEVHALDYLLKPFDKARFAAALDRAKTAVRRTQDAGADERLLDLLQTVQNKKPSPERLVVKSGGRISFVRIEDIDWIEAAANYVRLHVGKETHLLRESMSGLESKLDSRRFVRVHRSSMVNIERIRELQPAFHGDYAIILRDGTELSLSRGYREKLEETLGHSI
jgi:two-component system, LytTR family, response regulator